MFVISNLLIAIAKVLDILLTFLYWLILIRALISWVNPDPSNPLVEFLYNLTDPILSPIRKILPLRFKITIDISPIIAFLLITFLRLFLIRSLLDLASRLG